MTMLNTIDKQIVRVEKAEKGVRRRDVRQALLHERWLGIPVRPRTGKEAYGYTI